jgi:hypothetical protein
MSNDNNFNMEWIKGIDGIGQDNIISVCSNSLYVYVGGYYDSSASGINITDTITLPQIQKTYAYFIIQFDQSGIVLNAKAIPSFLWPDFQYYTFTINCSETHLYVNGTYRLFVDTQLSQGFRLVANNQGQQGYAYIIEYSANLNTINYIKNVKVANPGGYLLYSRVNDIKTNNENNINYVYWNGYYYGSKIYIDQGVNGVSGELPDKGGAEASPFLIKIQSTTGNIIFSYGIPSDLTNTRIRECNIFDNHIYIAGSYRS